MQGLELNLWRLRNRARRLWADAEAGLLGWVSRAPRRGNVVMFHVGRSGSTVLADLLNQHPKIFWDGEIYERRFRRREKEGAVPGLRRLPVDPVEPLRRRMARAGREFYGFEVKFFHLGLANLELPDYVESLLGLGFTHFIALERRNYLRKIASSVVAHERSQYHRPRGGRAVLTRVRLDVDNVQIDRAAKPLMAHLRDYHESFRALVRLLNGRRVLWLTYEDDVSADPLVGYRRICDFLGVGYHDVSVHYGRTNPFRLTDMLVNYEEVVNVLRGTAFEWMVDE